MHHREPLVSICVPTYNGGQYLGECISSIRSQTFTDFEVLICDDQSSDGTLELARKLAQGDERFRFIPNPRRFGLVGNWNNCIRQARGEWIKFVFQDDTIAATCIEKLLDACRSSEKPFAFCDRELIFESETPESQQAWYLAHRETINSEWRASAVITREQVLERVGREPGQNLVGEPTATLVAKSVFSEIGEFDTLLIHMCDLEFWNRALTCYGAAYVPERLATFRVHAGATSAANYAHRYFRTFHLDNLVLRYRIAFDQRYKAVRNAVWTGRSIAQLRFECAEIACDVWRMARDGGTVGDSASSREMSDWKQVTSQLPGIMALALVGRTAKVWNRMKLKLAKVGKAPFARAALVLKGAPDQPKDTNNHDPIA